MRLLMIGSDTHIVQGLRGAFWNTLREFHIYWECIHIICPYISNPKLLNVFGNVHFHPLPHGKLLSPIHVLREGLKIIGHFKPDLMVIHAYGMQHMSWGAYWLACKANIPFVVEVHHIEGVPKLASPFDYLRRMASFHFIKMAHERSKALRVVNRSELVPRMLSLGVPEEKLKVLYAIYLDRTLFFSRPNVLKKYEMIFVGRLVANKGLPLLLNAFEHVRREIPEARMLLVGRGPLENWLKKRLKEIDGIHHIPFLPSLRDVMEAYNQAKIVVCASSAEGGPRFVVEAMACGLPAVSTPVGLMLEVVKDGETGFLVHSWSAKEMAGKIVTLLRDEHLYRLCSRKAIEVANQFDYSKIIAEYALTYRRLVEG